jgi:hypothetical protein
MVFFKALFKLLPLLLYRFLSLSQQITLCWSKLTIFNYSK